MNKIPESTLMKAVALYEEGKGAAEIVTQFPEYEEELLGVFSLIKRLAKAKLLVVPPKAVLARMLETLPAAPKKSIVTFSRLQLFIPLSVGALALLLILVAPSGKRTLPSQGDTTFSASKDTLQTESLRTSAPMAAKSSAPAPDAFDAIASEINANSVPDDTASDNGLTALSADTSANQFDAAAADSHL